MNDREALRAAYDRQADSYGTKRNPQYDAFRDSVLGWFCDAVRGVGSAVLDLGSGPGHEAVLMQEHGLAPLAVDFSSRMVELCRARGVAAAHMDLYDLDLPAGQFAGAWISFSLLHIPKSDVKPILAAVHRLLVVGGSAVILLFEGTGEGPRAEDVKRFGTARYFSYYQPEELRSTVAEHFTVVRQWRLDISPRPTVAVCGRKEAPRAGHRLIGPSVTDAAARRCDPGRAVPDIGLRKRGRA